MNKEKPDEKFLRCEDCGDLNDSVEKTTCPFNEEINNQIIEITVCRSCYLERMWEI